MGLSSARAPCKGPYDSPTDDARDTKLTIDQIDSIRNDVTPLVNQIGHGKETAARALRRLLVLASEPNAKAAMIMMGVSHQAAELLKKKSSTVELKRLAASVLTVLTDLPVASSITEEESGSPGRILIVVPRPSRVYTPDDVIQDLRAGVQPSDTLFGDYGLRGHVESNSDA